jgi:hypothetical protein
VNDVTVSSDGLRFSTMDTMLPTSSPTMWSSRKTVRPTFAPGC